MRLRICIQIITKNIKANLKKRIPPNYLQVQDFSSSQEFNTWFYRYFKIKIHDMKAQNLSSLFLRDCIINMPELAEGVVFILLVNLKFEQKHGQQ